MDRWIALFSQTGSEIVDIAEQLGVWPDRIFTNNKNIEDINDKLKNKVVVMSHNGIEETLQYTSDMTGNTLVTLHGYLRILSPKTCDIGLSIYNGHPAYISKHPELKGKDPQEMIWSNKDNYDFIGSTVHRVIADVDAGAIEEESIRKNTCNSKEELYNTLRKTSLDAWINFLKDKL